jgi:hypothetical protein
MIACETTAKYEILLQSNVSVLAISTLPASSSFCRLSITNSGFFSRPDVAVVATELPSSPTVGGSLRILEDYAVLFPSTGVKAHTDPISVFQF